MTTYITDSEGKFIPATQRPDGTWRKARRVKQGYIPQEEVPLYESKGKKFAEKRIGQLPPGFSPQGIDVLKKEKQELVKTAKAKAAKDKKQKQSGLIEIKNTNSICITPTTATTATTTTTITLMPTNEQSTDDLCLNLSNLNLQNDVQELAKKLRKLRKKLREIEAIEEKLQSGELKKPEKDQLDKVKRKNEILKEIARLSQEENQSTHNKPNNTTTIPIERR